MNTITAVRASLEDALEHLKNYAEWACTPIREKCDLQDAVQRLRVLLTEECFVVSFSLVVHPSGAQGVDWTIWDGKKGYTGKTLEGAVNALLSAYAPAPSNPVLAIQEAFPVQVPF